MRYVASKVFDIDCSLGIRFLGFSFFASATWICVGDLQLICKKNVEENVYSWG